MIKEIRNVEFDYFCDNFKLLVKQYRNKWICIKGKEIVSSGDSPKEAYDKCKELGITRPFMTRVTEEGWSKDF